MLKLNLFNSNITNYKQLTHKPEKSCHEEPTSIPADFQDSGIASKNYASVVLTKPSNTLGFGTEHNIRLPRESVKRILDTAMQKINNVKTFKEKVKLFKKASKNSHQILVNHTKYVKKKLSIDEIEMMGDFLHEFAGNATLYNMRIERYLHKSNAAHDNPSDMDIVCSRMFASLLDTTDKYQSFLDKDLAGTGKTPLTKIVDMAMQSVQEKAKSNNIELSLKGKELLKNTSFSYQLPDYKKYFVISNLLDNAVKYSDVKNSPEIGKVEVEFFHEKDPKKGILLSFSVIDNGIGIPQEDKAKVLLGRRADNAVKSGILGTGHGLNRIEKIFNLKPENIISPLNLNSVDRKGTKITCPIAEIPLIKLPIKEMQDLTNQHLQEIISAKNPDEKVHICKKALKNIEEKYDNYYDSVKKSITEDEQNMLEGDFHHEFMGKICDLIDENINYFELKNDPNPRSRNRHKPLSPDFDKICAKTFTGITDAFKRYQSFLDKGLAGIKNVPVPEIFNLALDSVKDLSSSNNVEIRVKGQDLFNKADQEALTTDYNTYAIFSNLIQNAVKYSNVKDSSEKGKVLIEFSKDRDKKDIINLSVTDNGIGISPENHESVKEGERAGNAIESGVSGTGYGLKRITKILRYMDCKNDGLIITSPLNSESTDRKGTKITCPISRILENPQ